MGGKSGGSVEAGTVDPSAAMASYQKGADVIEKQFPIALSEWQAQTARGLKSQLEQYGKASAMSAPFSQTARDAVDELRFMLGMPKTSKSLGLSDELTAFADGAKGYTWAASIPGSVQSIADRMKSAELLTDPIERGAIKNEILNDIKNTQIAFDNDLIVWGNAMQYAQRNSLAPGGEKGMSSQAAVGDPYQGLSSVKPQLINGQYMFSGLKPGETPESYGYKSTIEGGHAYSGVGSMESNRLVNGTMSDQELALNLNLVGLLHDGKQKLADIASRFEETYTPQPNKAPTGQEIMDKLTSTPGYQFNLKQGEQVLGRTQAARGLLNSGKALVEAEKFGQGLAEQTYQGQIQNLANLAGINMPVTQQNIGNSTQLGQNLQNQYNLQGATTQQSIQDIARSRESAFIRSGDAQLQAALMNAQLQTQASMANAQLKQQSGAGMGQLAGSLLGVLL